MPGPKHGEAPSWLKDSVKDFFRRTKISDCKIEVSMTTMLYHKMNATMQELGTKGIAEPSIQAEKSSESQPVIKVMSQ